MGLKAVLDAETFEALDEGLKPFYVKAKDNKYVIDAEGVDDLPAVQGLKSTLEKFKKVDPDAARLARRMDALGRWESFEDQDPDEIRARLDRLDELEAGGGRGKDGDDATKELWEKRLQAASEKAAKDLAKKDAEIAQRDGFIEKLLVDNELDGALSTIAETGVIPETKRAVKAMIRLDYKPKVIREGDEYRAVVPTDMGDVALADWVDEWGRSDEAKAYLPPSGNQGTGAHGSGADTRSGANNPWVSGNMTEQGQIIRKDPEKARRLAAAAGKTLRL